MWSCDHTGSQWVCIHNIRCDISQRMVIQYHLHFSNQSVVLLRIHVLFPIPSWVFIWSCQSAVPTIRRTTALFWGWIATALLACLDCEREMETASVTLLMQTGMSTHCLRSIHWAMTFDLRTSWKIKETCQQLDHLQSLGGWPCWLHMCKDKYTLSLLGGSHARRVPRWNRHLLL